jgi:serine O-acetyltransferase
MRRLLRTIANDLRCKALWCYQDQSRRTLLKTLLADGSWAMILYRLMQASRRHRLWLLEMICNKWNSAFCQCLIGRGAEFGPGFVLIHANGVVINAQVRGGANVYIEHQVTLGAEKRQSPTLGDNVFIGAGAKIIGDVHVASNSRVGAGAVVLDDVPAGATVVGNPARVVRRLEERRTSIRLAA